MKISNLAFWAVSLFFFASCGSVKQIGDVNMISNRNVDSSADYEQLETYTSTSKKSLKKVKTENINDAIDKTVSSVAGGEYLMNCKIYLVKGKYIAVVGDVWGIPRNEMKGFRINDLVQWKENFINKQGVIQSFKDNETAVIETEKGKFKEISLEDLTIIKKGN